MSRGILTLLSVLAGSLAGCTTPAADRPPSTAVSVNSTTALKPTVIMPGAAAPVDSPNIVTPGGVSTSDGTKMSQFTSTPIAGLPQCNQYSATATVGGKPQPVNGEACQQPDGSWHIAERPTGSSVVYQTVYWPPVGGVAYNACFNYPYNYPCLYNFPFGFSIGFPVFIDIHRHFHHFVYNGQFHHYGPIGNFAPIDHFSHVGAFHDGFHNGFHGGFEGGFRGQFHGGFSRGGFYHK
jgi:hypothetical protein